MLVTLLLLAVTGISVLLLTFYFTFYARFVLVVFASVYIYSALVFVPFFLEVFGFKVFIQDVISIPLIVASLVRTFQTKWTIYKSLTLLVMIGLLLAAILRSLLVRDLGDVATEATAVLYFWVWALYFSTIDLAAKPQLRNFVSQALFSITYILIIIIIIRWTQLILGISVSAELLAIAKSSGGLATRVIAAGPTFFLGIMFFLSLYFYLFKIGTWWQRYTFILLVPIILVMQHRTVWVIVLAGLVWMLLNKQQFKGKRFLKFFAALGFAVLTITIVAFSSNEELIDSIEVSASNLETFEWRLDGWNQLLFTSESAPANSIELLLGNEFGSGYIRYINNTLIDVNPHNYYIQMFLRLGFSGLLLFVGFFYLQIRQTFRFLKDERYSQVKYLVSFFQIYLIIQLLYFISYPGTFEQGVFLGLTAGLYPLPRSTASKKLINVKWASKI